MLRNVIYEAFFSVVPPKCKNVELVGQRGKKKSHQSVKMLNWWDKEARKSSTKV